MPHSVHNTASNDMSATTTALEGFRMCELLDLLFSTVNETASDAPANEWLVTAGAVDAIVWCAVAVLL
jgi:hypothetical protein